MIITILTSGLSVALVNLIIELIRSIKPGKQAKAIQSILRDRITSISLSAIEKGSISVIDYQNLRYLYQSYIDYNGNSYVISLVNRVDKEAHIGED